MTVSKRVVTHSLRTKFQSWAVRKRATVRLPAFAVVSPRAGDRAVRRRRSRRVRRNRRAGTRARLDPNELKLPLGPISVPPPLPPEQQGATR